MPRATVEHEVARGTLKMLDFQEGTFLRPLAIIYKRGRELSPAVRKFIDTLTQSGTLPKVGPGKAARVERAGAGDGPATERTEKVEKSA